MTTNDISPLVGKTAYLTIHPLRVLVHINDTRAVWGRVDCLITPIHGSGEQWVSFDRLKIN